jgi:hypothetical protein
VDYKEIRKQIRRQERLARKDAKRMSRLEQDLLQKLPSSLIPGNVGNYYDVAWPFEYVVNFDFGTNPTWPTSITQANYNQSFQVSQEAAFIVGNISRKCYSGSTSGELAPLLVQFRDRQSTRQFMDNPIPIQAIAKKTPPTTWEMPLILMPNAFMDVNISSFQTIAQPTVGSGKITFTFAGYRTRTSDIQNVLSTIFGR